VSPTSQHRRARLSPDQSQWLVVGTGWPNLRAAPSGSSQDRPLDKNAIGQVEIGSRV